MMRWQKITALSSAAILTITVQQTQVIAAPDTDKTLQESVEVFQEMMGNAETRIPANVLQTSQAIAILPDVSQGGFIFGGRRGNGVMMVREADGTWSNPAFVNVTGGSFGLQAGYRSSDLVLVLPNQRSVNDILDSGSLELGGSVSGTAISEQGTAIDVLDDLCLTHKSWKYCND